MQGLRFMHIDITPEKVKTLLTRKSKLLQFSETRMSHIRKSLKNLETQLKFWNMIGTSFLINLPLSQAGDLEEMELLLLSKG